MFVGDKVVSPTSAFSSLSPETRRLLGRPLRTEGKCNLFKLQDEGDSVRENDVRFVAPLLEEGYPPAVKEYESNDLSKKPLLLYLPGFDGTVVAPFLQFPELGTIFDVRALTIDMSDRSTFDELKTKVIDFILKETQSAETEMDLVQETEVVPEDQTVAQGGRVSSFFSSRRNTNTKKTTQSKESNAAPRTVYLMGESFGGILASDVALTLLEEKDSNLGGLVLINPATCYDRSKLAFEGPRVASLPKFLYPFGLLRLIPLFTDKYSLPQLLLLLKSEALPSVIDTPAREAYMGRVAFSLPFKLKFMPQDTLSWRLDQWLARGCARMVTKLELFRKKRNLKTLIVAGEMDMTLPSIAEAERLAPFFQNCKIHVVEGAGHASTCGSRVDLAALMRGCFRELRKGSGGRLRKRGRDAKVWRTEMKPEAAKGEGVYYGLEPRYNGEEVGLSPLLYWSKELYRKWNRTSDIDQINGGDV